MKNLKAFFKDWRNFTLIAALAGVAGWVFSRVSMVNPAILGDEYLYSINARHAAPWDPSPAGDFSNYLFNLVYSSTNICGDAFYTCGKILNLIFLHWVLDCHFHNCGQVSQLLGCPSLYCRGRPVSDFGLHVHVPARVDVFLHDQLGVLGRAESC